jgi:hypothetical protein
MYVNIIDIIRQYFYNNDMAGHAACMGEMRSSYKFSAGNKNGRFNSTSSGL